MFGELTAAPPDGIFGLKKAYNIDSNPAKINLTVGVYKDDEGKTPIFRSVKLAEARLFEEEKSKAYLGIPGSSEYAAAVQALVFGADHEVVTGSRAVTVQTPGGTGALRVAADFLQQLRPEATVWMSEPTWANHKGVFGAAGLKIAGYRYYDAQKKGLDFAGMIAAIEKIPAHDIILLHGCCHNPTGVDPTPAQWKQIADACAERSLLPLVDFAYQGFGDGLDEDAAGLRAIAARCDELFVCSSFSKNFSLYNERVGLSLIHI